MLTVLSVILFIYSLIHLFQNYEKPEPESTQIIHGFEDNSGGDEYNKLVTQFHQKISAYSVQASRDQSMYFWLNFLVTALTAGSTLASSVQAAKKDSGSSGISRTVIIVIAVLTFCSALSNFGSAHFNDLKTEDLKKSSDLITKRNQFFVDYSKAPDSVKSIVIRSYADQMD